MILPPRYETKHVILDDVGPLPGVFGTKPNEQWSFRDYIWPHRVFPNSILFVHGTSLSPFRWTLGSIVATDAHASTIAPIVLQMFSFPLALSQESPLGTLGTFGDDIKAGKQPAVQFNEPHSTAGFAYANYLASLGLDGKPPKQEFPNQQASIWRAVQQNDFSTSRLTIPEQFEAIERCLAQTDVKKPMQAMTCAQPMMWNLLFSATPASVLDLLVRQDEVVNFALMLRGSVVGERPGFGV